MLRSALTVAASFAFVTALMSAQPPQRAPDPRSMGGGDCRDNAYNCADAPNPLPASNTVWLEEMTWMDVRDSLKAGHTTAIIATGGMEPNGPWLVTGKHNYVRRTNCEAIARKLGNALCGVDISNLNRSREWARAIVDARATRTVELIKQAITEKKSS